MTVAPVARPHEHAPCDAGPGRYAHYPLTEPLFRRFALLPISHADRTVARHELISLHLPLADNLARKFAHRGQPTDDLIQVARVGLLKAIDRFDPTRNIPFLAFAIPTITGELRRHFRDTGWDVRVPRRLQELQRSITAAVNELSQRDGCAPTASVLAEHLGVPREEVINGLQADHAYASISLDLPTGPEPDSPTLGHTLGEDDPGMALVENHEALQPLLAALPERERRILGLRFFAEMSQSQIAQEIGVSQMHVSRLLAKTLAQLRAGLLVEN
ncbi:RNA polymerase sigma factor SigF [Cryptosporangium sp. NPDC048952]|uniref:RNA polymerase sigma factor SigF n=1 Tax=Cryptosporangium sp. NPDC048952 TaxID=3363961 RepID=UPI00371F7247